MSVVDFHHQRSQAASLPIRIRPAVMFGSETWAAPSTVMERSYCTKRKQFRRLLGYFWPRVCHNLHAEIDVVYRRMTRGKYQHLAPPSKVAKVNRLLWSYIKETGRSPCLTRSEEFVGFEPEDVTWPKTEVLD
ncbi:hypothetical protein RB195_019271 [Necator americanus]|uniref:Uncharacterized protein n=1 Tax=Necator americanus TaxID=51031 RepID=A0ABR1CDE3_NECAM